MASNSANSYSDGFPKEPLQAIDFSSFLSDSEKQEWRDWLNNATPEQRNELVDILHSMWIENQKTSSNPNSGSTPAPVNNNFSANPAPQNKNPFGNNNQNPQNNFNQNPIPPAPQPAPFGNNNQNPQNNNFSNSSSNPFGNSRPLTPNPATPKPTSNPFTKNANTSFDSSAISQAKPKSNFDSSLNPNPKPNFPTGSSQNVFGSNSSNNSSGDTKKTSKSGFDTNQKPKNDDFYNSAKNISSNPFAKTTTSKPAPSPSFKPASPKPISKFTSKPQSNFDLEQKTYLDENNDKPFEYRNPKIDKEKTLEMEDLVGKSKYEPNPLISGKSSNKNSSKKTRTTNTDKDEKSTASKPAPAPITRKTKPVTAPTPAKSEKSSQSTGSKKTEINYQQVKQDQAKEALEEIYQEYSESVKSQEKYTRLLEKVTLVLKSYDQVTGYFESIMDKVLKMNDNLKDVQKTNKSSVNDLKNSLTTVQRSVQKSSNGNYQIKKSLEELREEFYSFQDDTNRTIDKIEENLAAIGVDLFGPKDSAKLKEDIFNRRLDDLQKKIEALSNNSGPTNQNFSNN